jgi:uncharacterized protein YqjF (DUF2071 family)
MATSQQLVQQKVLMTARFCELVALNFQIDPAVLQPHVPRGTELDFYKGETYVSLVAMSLRKIRVRGIPIHLASAIEEVNLRFYVKRRDRDAQHSGACFLKDFVSSSSAAWILSSVFKAEFSKLRMTHQNSGFHSSDPNDVPHVTYRWLVDDHWNQIRLKARDKMQRTGPETKVGFILDHSNEYSSRAGKTYEYRVERPAWTVWDAAHANFDCDVKRLFGPEFVKPLSRRPASVFVADGSEVTIFRPTLVA